MNKLLSIIIVLAFLAMSGCESARGRRTLDLPIPTLEGSSIKKGTIYISSIEDTRVFMNNPPEPSIPSIDGDVSALTQKEREMMIGRQRGGAGQALGDIALPKGRSVVERTRELIEKGFQAQGYAITSDSRSPISAKVEINQFWAWFNAGFSTQELEARVVCTIDLSNSKGSSTIIVQGHGLKEGIWSNKNWQLTYTKAFRDFLSNLVEQLSKTELNRR